MDPSVMNQMRLGGTAAGLDDTDLYTVTHSQLDGADFYAKTMAKVLAIHKWGEPSRKLNGMQTDVQLQTWFRETELLMARDATLRTKRPMFASQRVVGHAGIQARWTAYVERSVFTVGFVPPVLPEEAPVRQSLMTEWTEVQLSLHSYMCRYTYHTASDDYVQAHIRNSVQRSPRLDGHRQCGNIDDYAVVKQSVMECTGLAATYPLLTGAYNLARKLRAMTEGDNARWTHLLRELQQQNARLREAVPVPTLAVAQAALGLPVQRPTLAETQQLLEWTRDQTLLRVQLGCGVDAYLGPTMLAQMSDAGCLYDAATGLLNGTHLSNDGLNDQNRAYLGGVLQTQLEKLESARPGRKAKAVAPTATLMAQTGAARPGHHNGAGRGGHGGSGGHHRGVGRGGHGGGGGGGGAAKRGSSATPVHGRGQPAGPAHKRTGPFCFWCATKKPEQKREHATNDCPEPGARCSKCGTKHGPGWAGCAKRAELQARAGR